LNSTQWAAHFLQIGRGLFRNTFTIDVSSGRTTARFKSNKYSMSDDGKRSAVLRGSIMEVWNAITGAYQIMDRAREY